ncbi:hypothetical protein LRP88_06502 [Fusarium phalaenopsidis]
MKVFGALALATLVCRSAGSPEKRLLLARSEGTGKHVKRQSDGRCGTGFDTVCAEDECCSNSGSKFWNQMIYNEIALADILGYFPTYMRPPYSASNEDTNAWLDELGYHITYFNLDTEGYLHDSPNMIAASKAIWDNTVEGKDPETNRWLHIDHDPVYQTVYNLTEHMLQSIQSNGFRAVTVGECLQDPKDNWYRKLPTDD